MSETSSNCQVKGCSNKQTEGQFVGQLCLPCHTMLGRGEISNTTSFLKNLGAFKGFKVWDKDKKVLVELDEDGFGVEKEYNIYSFAVTPSGGLIIWNDYQDYLVDDQDKEFKLVFNS